MANRALAQQQLQRVRSVSALARLRKEARDEISRLIEFLDASDEYVMTEEEIADYEKSEREQSQKRKKKPEDMRY